MSVSPPHPPTLEGSSYPEQAPSRQHDLTRSLNLSETQVPPGVEMVLLAPLSPPGFWRTLTLPTPSPACSLPSADPAPCSWLSPYGQDVGQVLFLEATSGEMHRRKVKSNSYSLPPLPPAALPSQDGTRLAPVLPSWPPSPWLPLLINGHTQMQVQNPSQHSPLVSYSGPRELECRMSPFATPAPSMRQPQTRACIQAHLPATKQKPPLSPPTSSATDPSSAAPHARPVSPLRSPPSLLPCSPVPDAMLRPYFQDFVWLLPKAGSFLPGLCSVSESSPFLEGPPTPTRPRNPSPAAAANTGEPASGSWTDMGITWEPPQLLSPRCTPDTPVIAWVWGARHAPG